MILKLFAEPCVRKDNFCETSGLVPSIGREVFRYFRYPSFKLGGYEFLDDARNDTVWNKVTATIKNAATTASFEVLVEMLKAGVLAAIQK